MKNVMGSMHYHKCIANKKGWVNEKSMSNCKAWAEVIKKKYPRSEDWYCVRFSDKIYFGYDPQGKLYIIRKPSEQYCLNCIQEDKKPNKKDKKRYHC